MLKGESGFSSYDYDNRKKDTAVSYNDYFIDTRLIGALKSIGLKISAGYLNVGPQFSSPSAQTQRIYPFTAPDVFPLVMNAAVTRSQTLFDRLAMERMYNQSISPVLFQVLPQYSNVLPYGLATPNRKGITAGIYQAGSKKVYELEAEAFFLSDIVGEGTKKLRNYMLIRGGFALNIHTLANIKRNIILSGGIKNENTKRDGFADVNFSSMLIDAGLSIETIKDLDILAGIKLLNAKGNEYVMVRDEYNYAVSFIDYNADINQKVISGGLRYRFTEKSFATVNYNKVFMDDNLSPGNNFDMNQLFLNYTVRF